MMRGMRNMNPRRMETMMRQMGMKTEEIPDVEEVLIRTPTKEYRIIGAQVAAIVVQGQKIYQVTGETTVADRIGTGSAGGAKGASGADIPEEDVMLVAQQASVPPDVARTALVECKGNPAEAIMMLMKQ